MAEQKKELFVGDLLILESEIRETAKTHVEFIEGNVLWVQEIMSNIWKWEYKDRIYTRIIKKNEVFSFYVQAIGNEVIDGFTYTKLIRLTSIEEDDRRESYRLKSLFDVFLRDPVYEESDFKRYQGIDLSDTGLAFMGERTCKQDRDLECYMTLEGERFDILVRVVRIIPNLDTQNKQNRYKMGARFVDMDKHMRKKVLKYIYFQQAKKRK